MEERYCCFIGDGVPQGEKTAEIRRMVTCELCKIGSESGIVCLMGDLSAFEETIKETVQELSEKIPGIRVENRKGLGEQEKMDLIQRCQYCFCYLPQEGCYQDPMVRWALKQNVGLIPIGEN